jgi:hypothetical protein
VPRYLLTTKREARVGAATPTALDVASSEPGVSVVQSSDPHMVIIDASAESAERLRQKFGATHFVEPEIRRNVQ